MFDPTCLRRTANWSSLEKEHKFDKNTFDPTKLLEDLPVASPKLHEMLKKIKELDENDLKYHGKTFKHFIFSEVKSGGYGARVIVGALLAVGMSLCYDDKLKLRDDDELIRNAGNNFGYLCSTTINEQTLPVATKKGMLEKYNRRPDNIQGELIRIIVADGGFKEGIDLFDVRYVHIFEPQTSEADLKQAIGRATRKCGQAGLEFHPSFGWTLNVYIYDVLIPEKLKGKLDDAETLFDLYLKNTNMDFKKVNFAKQMEQNVIFGAVDYPLNRNIIDLRGGARKNPIPPKLGDEVFCDRPCSINRPSKYVPVSLPLFITVAIVVGAELPEKKLKKPRQHFCKLLRTNRTYCHALQRAFVNQAKFINKYSGVLVKAIEQKVHMKINSSLRVNFLKFIYTFSSYSAKKRIINAPEVREVFNSRPRIGKNTSSPKRVKKQYGSNNGNVYDTNSKATTINYEDSIENGHVEDGFEYLLSRVPRMTEKLHFKATRDFIVDNYGMFTWPKVEMENLCVSKGGNMQEEEPSAENVMREMEEELQKVDQEKFDSLNNGVNRSTLAKFTPTQDFIRHYFTPDNPYKGMLLFHSVGTGKCHAKDTPILMFDGSVKMVQDIIVGDLLMGDDSTPRKVLSLARGHDELFDVVPNKGDTYRVNSEHILVLKYNSIGITHNVKRQPKTPFRVDYFDNKSVSKKAKSFKSIEEAKQFMHQYQHDDKRIVEIEVKDFLRLAPSMQKELKGIRTGVEFQDNHVLLDPYFIGLWLGDGSSRDPKFTTADKEILDYITSEVGKFGLQVKHEKNYDYRISGNGKPKNNVVMNALREYDMINNKHIPQSYLVNSREKRLRLLAGLIDTDGYYDKKGHCYEIIQKSDILTSGILYLARSLGFAAYNKRCTKTCVYKNIRKEGVYNRMCISGNITEIPVMLPRKKAENRNQLKDVQVTGIKIASIGIGEYYGFTLDGNNRYLLGDFTITHNTCTAIATATSSFEREGWTVLWVTRTTLKDDIWKNMFDTVCSLNMQEKLLKGTKFPQKLTDKMRLLSKSWSIRPMSYKQFTNLVAGNNKSLADLVKKNGSDDPLRKTLLIIDEAHKLYGGSDLLPAEKPDMKKLNDALQNSYQISGKDSVKLLLMTATPYTKDPMELIKLLNLLQEKYDKLPTSFDEFQQVFLDESSGVFTEEGRDLFLEKINGLISFLDRGNDAREFAQPKVSLVTVPLSLKPVADIIKLKQEHDINVVSLKNVIKQLDESFDIFKGTKLEQVKDELKHVCGHLKGQSYIDCKNKSTPYIQLLLRSIEEMSLKIKKIQETHTTEIQRLNTEFNRVKEIAEHNISQEHVIGNKCVVKK